MKLIRVEGTHKEMGIQQGKELKERIKLFRETMTGSVFFKTVKPKFLPNWFIIFAGGIYARRMLKKYLNELSHHYERIEGIAEGSGQPSNFIFTIHALEAAGADTKRYYTIPGCTSILLSDKVTTDNELILGKNYDMYNNLLDYQIVRISKPKGRYSSICITQDFLAGNHNGINECGVCIVYTYGYPWQDYSVKGVPITILIQEALETCKNTEEVINFFERTKRPNGANLGIADEKGNICVLETSRSKIKIRKLDKEGFLIHTNHYVHPEMIPIDTPDNVVYKLNHPKVKGKKAKESSILRYNRAKELIERNINNLSEETLKSIFRDHGEKNIPSETTICRHFELWGTLSSYIFYPKKRIVKVVNGNPCQDEYKTYKLE